MRSLFDNFVSTIVFVVIVFTIAAFSTVELQIMSARHIHNSAINQIQSSYYMVDIKAINDKIHEDYPDGWYIESTVVDSVNNRQNRLVTMHYEIKMPLFGISQKGEIQGYAR